jgi:hypothetical protein
MCAIFLVVRSDKTGVDDIGDVVTVCVEKVLLGEFDLAANRTSRLKNSNVDMMHSLIVRLDSLDAFPDRILTMQ